MGDPLGAPGCFYLVAPSPPPTRPQVEVPSDVVSSNWAVEVEGTASTSGNGIAHDGAGGAFVTGVFSGTASFGGTSLTSRGSFDAFVLHVTASGLIDWAIQAGGASYDQGFGIAHDGANGGAFVTGTFAGEAHFGSHAVTSRGVYAVFVMHVTASGVIDWVVQAGGMGADNVGRGIAHDGSGGALETGTFDGNGEKAWFGSIPLTSRGRSNDAFVMHVKASGVINWVVQAGAVAPGPAYSSTYVGGQGIAHDGAGGALVTGDFRGEALFGSTSFASRDSDDASSYAMHVTASGVIDWALQLGGAEDDVGLSIASDDAGGVLVTGHFTGEGTFGSKTLSNRGGHSACFVVSLVPTLRPPVPALRLPPPALAVQAVSSGVSILLVGAALAFAAAVLFALMLW